MAQMGSLAQRMAGLATGRRTNRSSWAQRLAIWAGKWGSSESNENPPNLDGRILVPPPHPTQPLGCSSLLLYFAPPSPPPRTQSPQLCPEMSRGGTGVSAARRRCVPGGWVVRKCWGTGGSHPASLASISTYPGDFEQRQRPRPGLCPSGAHAPVSEPGGMGPGRRVVCDQHGLQCLM